jgi:hypothetical protein
MATGMVKDEHRPETLTRSQLEAFRGPLDGNGAGDLVGPAVDHGNGRAVIVPPPVPLAQARACVECGGPLAGRQERFCSTRCRKRDQYRRGIGHPNGARTARTARRASVVPQEVTNGTAVDEDTSRRPAETRNLHAHPPGGSPFEQLVVLSALLPAGWRLEATAAAVTVTWQAY